MEPFALQKSARSRVPWIIAVVFFAVFAVWQLDLVPRIKSAATGKLADLHPMAEPLLPLVDEQPWDEIVDHSDSVSVASESDDPLIEALARQSEPVDALLNSSLPLDYLADPTSSVASRKKKVHDNAVRTASYESIGRQGIEDDIASRSEDAVASVQIIPAELASQLRDIDILYRDQRVAEAHAALSSLYWKKPQFRSLIKSRLEHTASLIFATADQHFEQPYDVQFGDTLGSIAAQYHLSWNYLARLNRTSPEKLQAGQQLKVITGPFSAVVDLDDFAMTIHAHGWFLHRYQIGIGKDNKTPIGEFTVQEKLENPTWYNPDGGQVDADDPSNPLGEYWLGLGDHIGIHGTIDPESIGASKSRGCIHLADPDIEEVFHLLTTGSKVTIRR